MEPVAVLDEALLPAVELELDEAEPVAVLDEAPPPAVELELNEAPPPAVQLSRKSLTALLSRAT